MLYCLFLSIYPWGGTSRVELCSEKEIILLPHIWIQLERARIKGIGLPSGRPGVSSQLCYLLSDPTQAA